MGTVISCSECFRACGWEDGRIGSRLNGDETRGDDGAVWEEVRKRAIQSLCAAMTGLANGTDMVASLVAVHARKGNAR